ncbi:MAG TPA: glycosyltransferase family 39 protein [Chloroflexota bacterium]|nr:glycosyltransferase family 39 protein [Chloroflexota bacterium]
MNRHRDTWQPLAALAFILLLGWWLRLYALDAQSMWTDEGLSLYRAQLALPDVLRGLIVIDGAPTQDTNPPFYFLLLYAMRVLAGDSIFALRLAGVLLGLLNIPLIYQLGKRLFGAWTGVGAAFLLAISPLHVWQSQEMRNYTLLLFFTLLSVLALVCFWQSVATGVKWSWLVLWGVAGVAAILSHYFGVFVFAFGVLVLLIIGLRYSLLRRLPGWVWGTAVVLLLLLLIVAGYLLPRFLGERQFDFAFVPLADLLNHTATAFGLGVVPGFLGPWWRVGLAWLLALWGGLFAWRQGKRGSVLLLVGYLLVPLLLLVALSALSPLYNGPRHLIMSLPPLLVLMAAGVFVPGRYGRIPGMVLAGLLIISQVAWLRTQFTDPALVKDDLQGLAHYLNQAAQPGDLIVLHDTIIQFPFDYYYEGAAPWTAVPALAEHDTNAARQRLAELGAAAERVWFVTQPTPRTGFPITALTDWAEANWPRLDEKRFASLWLGVKVVLFAPDAVQETAVANLPLLTTYDNQLNLHTVSSPTEIPSGSIWQPIFTWSHIGTDETEKYYLLALQFNDGTTAWWETSYPLWETYPPFAWPADTAVTYRPPMQLPAGLPPGEYQVWLQLLDRATHLPISGSHGDAPLLLLPQLTVTSNTAVPTAALPEYTPRRVQWPGLDLVGYDVPAGTYRPGHLLPIDLYWQAQGGAPDSQLVVQLLDGQGQLAAETITTPTRADYPPSQWQAGELLHGRAHLVIPAQAASGNYHLRLALRDPLTGGWQRGQDGWRLWANSVTLPEEITVEAWPLVTELPTVAQPVNAQFGDPALARLAGVTWETTTLTPGSPLTLTLAWQTESLFPANYAVFLHLTDESGQLVAQQDAFPLQGARPTTSWRPGEVLSDEHTLMLPPDLPPGNYTLWLGLYNPDTGERLPVMMNGELQADGRLRLGTIDVWK